MKILQVEEDDHYREQQFIDLPTRIYRNVPQWVPPFSADNQRIFDRKRNPYYKHSKAAFFLAISADGAATGRLAILNNHHYNKFNNEATAFFSLFECVNDPMVSNGLFEAGFDWARQQGLNKIVGPRGFSVLDGLGMLVKGFTHRPALGIAYNPAYYPKLMLGAGFSKESDIVSGYLSTKMELPEKIDKVAELVKQRRGLHIARVKTRNELRPFVEQLKELYNRMIEGIAGNAPLLDDEANAIADQLLRFADPKLIKVIMKDEKAVGFLFAYPDISAALQRTQGRIYPFGWIEYLSEMHRTEWVNINGAGILPEYQGLGGTAILFSEMYKSIKAGKFKHAEIVQIGVENDKMQRELKELGIDFYKTHRIYQRTI